ncbi:hypothetical protein BXT86_03645 [candidate division WOR-3 bacterium 4484_100]|uniref:DNA polymerase III subunit gamma/tau n=1 Tax=candidate division WOR-3 bacterium 4484_100 TaxID=1936077 RepID=A0A1V4QF25_UNCW3|nr:MAG: hypothetical protein BXT86_03645 [candidate division WOR-3 bacterium 4484_100]
MHQVISLKYRPQNFDEITGQNHVVLSLKGAIKRNRVGHAYLFAGPRGVGKTTTARILAKSLNCVEGPTIHPCQQCQSCIEITRSRSIDVIEIDGASNRGIDEIRNLRESVRYSPIHSRYKIYIIDEVHMLTQEAFNALLKTLEEPPPNVIFIFATTNPTKVPQTILSRCERFTFKRLSVAEIKNRLNEISQKEGINITEKALHYIAVRADGSIRDGESILEQLTSFTEDEITAEDVFKLIGFLGTDFYFELLSKISENELGKVLTVLNKGIEDGADPIEIYQGFTNYLRTLLLVKTGLADKFLDLTDEEIGRLRNFPVDIDRLITMIEISLRNEDIIRRSLNTRIGLELLLSQLTLLRPGSTDNKKRFEEEQSLKSHLFRAFQKKSPKLAGIISNAKIDRNGDIVDIMVENDFSLEQLQKSQSHLKSLLKDITGKDCQLNIHLAESHKNENELMNKIKVLFDGEEIR